MFTFSTYAQIAGCTDPLSLNYNDLATENDGSCSYPSATVAVTNTVTLPMVVAETSGLIEWNGQFLTHNDNSDTNLYAVNAAGAVIAQYPLDGVTNTDWEEISQDEQYIYVGDFGNNVSGSRTDLKILRISKSSLLQQQPIVESINFMYQNQTSFEPQAPNTTDFDCEAFVVSHDFIYLFTKQWTTNGTTIYQLPKEPGQHVAVPVATLDVQGLITAATFVEDSKIVTLAGYSPLLQPFVFLLYDFNENNFITGNRRKMNLSLPFHQIEGISTTDGINYKITNELFIQGTYLNIAPKLQEIDLNDFLGLYINSLETVELARPEHVKAFYNEDKIHVQLTTASLHSYDLYDSTGRSVLSGLLDSGISAIEAGNLSSGLYFLKIRDEDQVIKILVQ